MRLMLVDDDQVILNGLISIIKRHDGIQAEIITAFDGIDAMEKLKCSGADLIVTDISMPGMNGLELVKEAKEKRYCSRFVILTGFDEFSFARQAIRYQVNDYLLKPINKDELLGIILKVQREIRGEDIPKEAVVLPDIEACRLPAAAQHCSETMKRIMAYIDENFMKSVSLCQISDIFDLHPNYICGLFSHELGMTFLNYLDTVRIRKSLELLLDGTETVIRDIAGSSGFMNERHFYKVFKKRMGVTPGEFREKYGSKA